MATRKKKTIVQGVTREECERAFSDFAVADAKHRKISAQMDEKIAKIREKYQSELADLKDEKDAAFEVMQAWAMENRDEYFSKKKSLESAHGTMGFRLGTPKLKTLKGFTWGAVTKLLEEFMPQFVRTTTEPAKDLLLASREDEEVAANFSRVGIMVAQDETFFVECKVEEVAV
ncbi:TPA_asm: Mu Gam-like, Ku ortholog [Porphyromonas phage phage006a_EM3]|uniref:Mu Gam-like, Ku ortholog n=1 Tax=Porphyromonas phage phage006a_EM3 TaxID=3154098 RepID=A0AAT9J806_9CAUD|nr:host-nuclease inhibitor Gam family protein [Porphyromonas gingivalis]MCE8170496.1 host-nuclease inhibitor Gam family protein [Porphyromonas gingivalis]